MKLIKHFQSISKYTLCVGLIVGGIDSSHAATTLRLAHSYNPGEVSFEMFNKLAEMVEERSNGELKIQVFPSEQLGSEIQLLQQASTGSVDITVPGYSGASTLVPSLEISNAPYIFQSWDEAEYVLKSDAYQPMFDQLKEEHRLIPLDKTWYWGWRNFTFKDTEVHNVQDLAGLKLRVPESPAWVEMIKAFGASPTPIPFSEVYLALQQGTVDGQENPIPAIYDRKFYEVQDYLVMTKHMLQSQIVLINNQRFDSLSEENQEILKSAVQELSKENYSRQSQREEDMLEEIKDSGTIKVIEQVDRESFEKTAEQAHKSLTSRWGEENRDRVMAKIKEYRDTH